MANPGGYQPNWFGGVSQNQPQIQNGQVNQQTPQPMNFGMFEQNVNPLIIVPVQSEAAANNYIVARGVTAFLINYQERVFWTKRQTDDGLGYSMVKHYFRVENEKPHIESSSDEIKALREELNSLRKEFEDFIK